MRLTGPELVLALVAVTAGALVQGSVGFGLNLVAVPVVALLEPAALPATLVLVALPLTVWMVAREHGDVDRPGLAWILVGRVPGSLLGAFVVTVLAEETLAVLLGGAVLVAVALSVAAPPLAITPRTATAVGLASGAMGTATSIGGPPIALLYARREGPVLRATSAAAFLFGTLLSTAALTVAGEVDAGHWRLALSLTPGVAGGLVLARLLARRLDAAGWLRPAVLATAAVGGAATALGGLL